MKEFPKSEKLQNVHYEIRGKVMEEADCMTKNNINILKLNVGNPAVFNFKAPEKVISKIKNNMYKAEGYSHSKGIEEARNAILKYCSYKNIPNVNIDDIYIGNGVSELIMMSMQALLDKEDEILMPAPDYPLWTAAATLAGGKVVHYICDEKSNWYPDIEDIKKKISSKTKAIVIINPNNPTGALYPKEILEEIVKIARENDLLIFSDEIYDRLVIDDLEHISIASLASDLCVITFNGLSKSHMIAGLRIGWMCISGNKSKARGYIDGLNLLSSMRLCSNVPAQYAVAEALNDTESVKELLKPGGRIYEQREYIYNALNSIDGISVVKPKAAFYIFPKIDTKKFNIMSDEKFALDFLRKEKILIVQGSGFNWKRPDHFRIVYLPEISILEKATNGLENFLKYYKQ